MAFTIETYDRKYLDGMTGLFNTLTAFEPHIAPLDDERFIALVENKSYFDPQGLLVAMERRKVVGWVHACLAPGSEGHHDPNNKIARIRMLMFAPDRLKVGNALVAEATAWLAQSGQTEIEALHARVGYPFYRGLWMGGEPMAPSSLPQLQLALEVGGYKSTQESIFMTARMTARPKVIEPDVRADFADAPAQMKHEGMRQSWIGFEPMTTQAVVDGQNAGGIAWVIEPHVADRLGAACMNIWGLGVAEKHRRQGLAGALVSRAMAHSYKLGARFCSVGTQLWNAPAHATYAKLGFVPHCVLVGRQLDLTPEKKP